MILTALLQSCTSECIMDLKPHLMITDPDTSNIRSCSDTHKPIQTKCQGVDPTQDERHNTIHTVLQSQIGVFHTTRLCVLDMIVNDLPLDCKKRSTTVNPWFN